MKTVALVKNWVEGTTIKTLKGIHQNNVNIAIYNRNISILKNEIHSLLTREIKLSSSGNINAIFDEITEVIDLSECRMILQDINNLLRAFKEITGAKKFRLLLETIDTNMCRKFHTDINDLRILCTYSGPGTLWLTEDKVDRKALSTYRNNESIVIDNSKIKQVTTGAVIVLKGTKYSKESIQAAVHRSPVIEENSEKRLLLRIDTN